MKITPARVAALLTGASGLAAAISGPVANLDWSSTAAVLGGLAAILGAAVTFLKGQRAHEARLVTASPPTAPSVWAASTSPNVSFSGNTFSNTAPDVYEKAVQRLAKTDEYDPDPEPPTANPQAARANLDSTGS
jgi:hypothetical protein